MMHRWPEIDNMVASLPDAVTNDPQQVCEEWRNSVATKSSMVGHFMKSWLMKSSKLTIDALMKLEIDYRQIEIDSRCCAEKVENSVALWTWSRVSQVKTRMSLNSKWTAGSMDALECQQTNMSGCRQSLQLCEFSIPPKALANDLIIDC